MQARPAIPADAAAIVAIYNEGIADRVGTFETEPRSPAMIESWFDGRHPIVVVETGGGSSPSPPPRPIARATATPASPSFRSTWPARRAARARAAWRWKR